VSIEHREAQAGETASCSQSEPTADSVQSGGRLAAAITWAS